MATSSSNAITTADVASFRLFFQSPIYTVLPAASVFFYLGYFVMWPFVARKCAGEVFAQMDRIEQMCFRANIGSTIHSYAVVLLMIAAFCSDSELFRPENRLHQYYNPIGYATMCVTLGYFSLSVPWNLVLRCYERRTDVAPAPMLMHHCMVVIGALIYVLGGVCAFYGATAFACMELTNLFFIPRVLAEMAQWRMDTPLCTVNGLCLVITFVVFRVGICTAMAVLFTIDLASFGSPHATEWALVILAYVIFLGVLLLSWIWLRRVLAELRDGVMVLLHQRRALRSQRQAAAQRLAAIEQLKQPSSAPPTMVIADSYCPSRGHDQGGGSSSSSDISTDADADRKCRSAVERADGGEDLAPSSGPPGLAPPRLLGASSSSRARLDPLAPPAAAVGAAANVQQLCAPPTSARSRGLFQGGGSARVAPV